MTDREIRYVHHRPQPMDILPEEAVQAIKDATAFIISPTDGSGLASAPAV